MADVALVADTLTRNSDLVTKQATELAVHVLHAID